MKPATLALTLTTIVGLSACSSSGSSAVHSSTSPTPSGSATAGLCNSLTAPINAAAHASWRQPTETDNGPVHNCDFGPSDPGVLTVQIADGMSHVGFADNRAIVAADGRVQKLSGVGDEAYSQAKGGATLVASRQGNVGVVVQLQQGDQSTAVAIARAMLKTLAQ